MTVSLSPSSSSQLMSWGRHRFTEKRKPLAWRSLSLPGPERGPSNVFMRCFCQICKSDIFSSQWVKMSSVSVCFPCVREQGSGRGHVGPQRRSSVGDTFSLGSVGNITSRSISVTAGHPSTEAAPGTLTALSTACAGRDKAGGCFHRAWQQRHREKGRQGLHVQSHKVVCAKFL